MKILRVSSKDERAAKRQKREKEETPKRQLPDVFFYGSWDFPLKQ